MSLALGWQLEAEMLADPSLRFQNIGRKGARSVVEGAVAERLKAAVLKTVKGASPS